MTPFIQISNELIAELNKRKFNKSDSFEELIWNLIENTLELSEETLYVIQQAQKDYKNGRTISHTELINELGI